MRQYGPHPADLESLVAQVRYRDGWKFWLAEKVRDSPKTHGETAGGLTLSIRTKSANSHDCHVCETCQSTVTNYRVNHMFIVPAATWDRQGWLDWLMDCIEQVEMHEAREFFHLELRIPVPHDVPGAPPWDEVPYSEYPFAPNHGPGRDPYRRYSYASDADRRTSFRGELKAP